MAKKKLTLSVDEDLLSEAKKLSALEGKSLSGIVEEYFEGLVIERWARDLCGDLGLVVLEPTTESEVPRNRPKGLDAAKTMRGQRDGRARGYRNCSADTR
jgi:hypothetical protein